MSAIEILETHAYYAPTARRRYFTKAGAIRAEAIAIIKKKHPTEPFEYASEGPCGGFHWRELPNSDKLLRRMIRVVKKQTMGDH